MDLSLILPVTVTALGIFLIIGLRFFFIAHPIRTLKIFLNTLKDKRNRTALYLALAGTLGVGNVFGVATALVIGGEGSIFWLLLSAFFSMIIKYSETTLAASASDLGRGTQFVIKKCFPKSGVHLSKIYAFLCLSLALFMGASMQSAAIYDSVNLRGENRMIFAFLFCISIAFSVIGGTEKIEKITSFIIPVTTIIYILLSFSVVLSNLSSLDDAILCVFKNAFTPTATVGGTVGFLSSKAIKEGFARGILSNEAGLGTSAMAHVRGGGRRAAEAGLYGMCEVFFDTVLLCPLTALMILVSGVVLNAYDPMHLVRASVCTTIGEPFGYILGLLILGFGYSTVCCWFYYGEECFCYLFGDARKKAFIVFYLLFVMLGAILDQLFIVFLTDSFILAMSFVMSALLLKEIKTVRNATREIGLLKTDGRVF